LGIGDWGLGPIPNPQSPIPFFKLYSIILILFEIEYKIKIIINFKIIIIKCITKIVLKISSQKSEMKEYKTNRIMLIIRLPIKTEIMLKKHILATELLTSINLVKKPK